MEWLTAIQGGASLFNMYAQHRATQEQSQQLIKQQRYYMKEQKALLESHTQDFKESTTEYAAISSYNIDMLRQNQMHERQVVGYNLLRSGIGITGTDSAGLLLRHQAYMDEMKARSVEAEMYHKRPKNTMNQSIADLRLNQAQENISNIQSSQPWNEAAIMTRGAFDILNLMNRE